jgi:PBSX family phage terminase large subunit
MKKGARRINYTPLPYQASFHNSTKPKAYLSAGYGAGKTYSLVMKMFQLMHLNKGIPGGIVCPTIKMYKRDVYPTILEVCSDNGIPHKYNKTDMAWFFHDTGSLVYVFHGEDDGASIKGPNLGWMAINEVTLCSRMAFLTSLSRVRVRGGQLAQVAMSGTPESFNWAYEYFIENPREDTDLIFGDSRLNKHVADGYIGMLTDSYDERMQEQYISGKFVNLTASRAAYAFDRFKHAREGIKKIKGAPVFVSLDFNVNPMAAVLWNYIPMGINARTLQDENYILQAFDEIAIESSNTYELCEVLKSKLEVGDKVTIFPDPAGRALSTKSANQSDFDILKQAGFTDLKFKPQISVRDCVNALNNAFDKNAVVLNSKTCRNAIADLEQCTFKEGAFELDKSNPRRTHWLDGMKNMVEYLFPVRRPAPFRTERMR